MEGLKDAAAVVCTLHSRDHFDTSQREYRVHNDGYGYGYGYGYGSIRHLGLPREWTRDLPLRQVKG